MFLKEETSISIGGEQYPAIITVQQIQVELPAKAIGSELREKLRKTDGVHVENFGLNVRISIDVNPEQGLDTQLKVVLNPVV